MSAGYKPDHWDAVRTGEREEEEAACEAFATKPVPRILSQQEWIGQATSCGPSSVFSFGSALA